MRRLTRKRPPAVEPEGVKITGEVVDRKHTGGVCDRSGYLRSQAVKP